MARTLGSKNKPKQASVVQVDGYAQAFSGAGTRRDRSTFTTIKGAYLLGEGELTDIYIGDGFAKTIVDVPAEECVAAGVDFEDMDEALEDKIQSRYEELNVLKHAGDAFRWSRLYGGAVMVLGLNDGGTMDVPFQQGNLKEVEFIRVYNRFQAIVQSRVMDPMDKRFGEPELWQIIPYNTGSPYIVHNSRIRVIDGEACPARLREANLQWGLSSLQGCMDQLKRLGMSHLWANMLLERAQQAVHGIPNLAQTLMQPGGDAMVQKRVDVVDMVRGTLNTVVIDANETYTIASPGVGTGVTDLLDRYAEALAGVSRIPVYILMGKSASGLNGSSDSNAEGWSSQIRAWQKDVLHDPLDWITQLLCFEQNGTDGGDYKLCFKSSYVPSEKERAEVCLLEAQAKKAQSETDSNYANIGSFTVNEVRSARAEDYGIDSNDQLSPDEIAAAVEEQAQVNARVKVQ